MSAALRLETFAGELVGMRVPDAARQAARDCLADALACAVLGQRGAAHRRSGAALAGVFGGPGGPATVWFHGPGHPVLAAAYLNSVAVSADDLDDGHRAAMGHPGGAVVPAVLAEIEALGRTDADVLDAIAVGYEAGVRVAAARTTERLPTLATGRWAAVAAAAVSCRLAGDDPGVTAAALAHAGALSPQLIAPDPRRPDGLKEGTPWAVVAGLVAARLARAGLAAPTYLLEAHPDVDPDRLATVAVGAPLAVQGAYFKRYSCCRWIHPVIDGLTALHSANPIDVDAVTRIEIRTFTRGLTLSNRPAPGSLEEAHYSFPFCAALAVVAGPEAFLPLVERSLTNRAALGLAARVTVDADPVLDHGFPARTPAVVRVHTRAGVREIAVDTAHGDPGLPFPRGVLRGKHRGLTRSLPTAAALEAALAADPVDATLLLDALTPAGGSR